MLQRGEVNEIRAASDDFDSLHAWLTQLRQHAR
jgi:hypothetical protein